MTTTVSLGDRVKDRITGVEGIVIGITEWLYNCRRPIVQPSSLSGDGKPLDSLSFDEPQLEVLETAVFKSEVPSAAEKTGGPRETPRQRSTPVRAR